MHTPSNAAVHAGSSDAAPGASEDPVYVVLTNAPDAAVADRIARALVDERLAACVNVLAGCRSVYRWKGAVETADEVPMLIKAPGSRVGALAARLRELHPYEAPELLALRADAGLPAYLDWVRASCA